MATTRQRIDSRGKSLLELLTFNQSNMANLINPSPTDGNTYDGSNPDKPVDILWPTADSRIGDSVEDAAGYSLREFNLDGVVSNTIGAGRAAGGGDGVLTEGEQFGDDVNWGTVQLNRGYQGKQHDQPFVTGKTGYAVNRPAFMEKSKRKSLATLYWEMRGAFVNNQNKPYFEAQGQDGEDKTYTNRFGGNSDNDTYDGNFVSQTSELYFPPSNEGLSISSSQGFNLGQILGGETSIIQNLIDKGAAITNEWFGGLIEAAGQNQFLASFLQTMQSTIMNITNEKTGISQLYRPGWTRAQQPNIHVVPLSELLQQNLLLPPSGGSLQMAGSNGSTFEQLYTNNRAGPPHRPSGMIDPQRYNKGTIAGTGINDLMEPLKDLDGSLADGVNGKAAVPFTFEDDDNVYLTHSKKHTGFTSNGLSTQSQPAAMESAVADLQKSSTVQPNDGANYRSSAAHIVGLGEQQYFPFTFSTVNKIGQRVQLCTLQASIQSLGEAYTPTWQSKHFFGRSEQVHTYTFTDRTIDLSFIIHADSMRQLQNVYERVLWLAQQCYPDYNSDDRISSGPIIAMRVGDLFQYKAGFIRSLSYDWNFLGPGGKWELTRGTRMPQACSVTMSYQVIHEKVPDRDYNFYGGPAGGLAAGFKNVKEIDYGATSLDGDDIKQATINGERYIPTHTSNSTGERGYLNYIDGKNEATTDANLIPFAGALDSEAAEPSWGGN